jgi:hypothetical protein
MRYSDAIRITRDLTGTISITIYQPTPYLNQTMDSTGKKIFGFLFFFIIILIFVMIIFNPEKMNPEPPSPEINPAPTIPENNPELPGFEHDWEMINTNADRLARNMHSTVIMPDGSIVLMGGQTNLQSPANDVWRSTDFGRTWIQMTLSAGWSPRLLHSSVAMPDGSIVLMGGGGFRDTVLNDTWRSTDNGTTWICLNESSGWPARYQPLSVVLADGSILLMGGYSGERKGVVNDVWRSIDNGATWTQMTASAGWLPRHEPSALALPDGSVEVMGGYEDTAVVGAEYYNDVWRSTDKGASWVRMTRHAQWSGRWGEATVATSDGNIFLTGGDDTGYTKKNDTWLSKDNGATWTLVFRKSGWPARIWASSAAMPDGSIVLMGGDTGGSSADSAYDVWRLTPSGRVSSIKNPTPGPTTTAGYSVPVTASEPSTIMTGVQNTSDSSRFINISPVEDFLMDSHYTITGPARLNITITTNFTAGSLFVFDIINEDSSRPILSGVVIPAGKGSAGLNTSSLSSDMNGKQPGHYRVEVRKADANTTAVTHFNITYPVPWTWIRADPVGEIQEGHNLNISGTTNLAAGSEISITIPMEFQPCTSDRSIASDKPLFCNTDRRYGCNYRPNEGIIYIGPDPRIVRVMPGSDGENTWAYNTTTKNWCWGETYWIVPRVGNWTNVTGGTSVRITSPENG